MQYRIEGLSAQQLATDTVEPITGTTDVVTTIFSMFPQMLQSYEEMCVMLCINDKMEALIGYIISIGTRTSTVAEPSTIFRRAISTRGCAAIILAHNHPVGDCLPSEDDLRATARILRAGDIIGVPLIDHIVIGTAERYCSIRGLMQDESVRAILPSLCAF